MNNFSHCCASSKKGGGLSQPLPRLFTSCWNFTSQQNKLVADKAACRRQTDHILGQQLTWMQWKTWCGCFYALEAGYWSSQGKKQTLCGTLINTRNNSEDLCHPYGKPPNKYFKITIFTAKFIQQSSHPPPPLSPTLPHNYLISQPGAWGGSMKTWAREKKEKKGDITVPGLLVAFCSSFLFFWS